MKRVRRWALLLAVYSVVAPYSAPATADSSWDSFVRDIGKTVYFFAFPTATYTGAELETVRPGGDGTVDVVFVVRGLSAFDHSALWTEVVLTMRGTDAVDVHWGHNNAIIAQPGETMKTVGQLITELNKAAQQQARSQTATAPEVPYSGVVKTTWVLTNRCRDNVQVRLFDMTKNIVWPENKDNVYLLAAGETREIPVSTYAGDKVCMGAATPDGARYWGVDLDSRQGCEGCCRGASTGTVNMPLGCTN